MYSRSPSRNHRSRGIKVKHILQICLLVAVCFWLIYQVKHSHEKKKEFDEKDAKLVSETHTGTEILKLGRKDISRVTEAGVDDKLHEVDDEENEADEENKHEEDEQEREESRTEDREEEEEIDKVVDDDEIDKHEEEDIDDESHEEEKIDDENHEEFVDEEKEREEGEEKSEDNDDGGKEDNGESVTVLGDQDHEGGDRNTHEAREEHYRADDASSEVAHDTRTTMLHTDNATVEHTDGNSELIADGKENVNQSSNEPLLEENSGLQIKEHEATEAANSSYSRVTESKEYKDNLTISEDSSSVNSTTLRESNDPSQASNNLTKFEPEHSTNVTQAQNATYEDSHNEGSNTPRSLPSHANTSDLVSDKNQLDIKTFTNFTQQVNTTSEESVGSSGEAKLALAENVTEPTKTNTDDLNLANAGTNKSPASDSENNVTAGEDESSISGTANDNTDADLHDHIGEFDSSLSQEEKEYRTDLGTLPDIEVEVQHPDDVEAE